MRSAAGPNAIAIARGILVHQQGASDTEDVADLVTLTIKRLAMYLGQVLGDDGVSALYDRALAMSRPAHPALAAAGAEAVQGPFASLRAALKTLERDAALDAGVTLLGSLLELLAEFIGGSLTVSLLQELWPRAFPNGQR